MKRFLLVVLIAFCLIIPAFAQNAKVQIIHNAADIDLATVDVYVDGALLLDNFSFRKATPFTEVAGGAHKVTVTPSTKTPTDSVIAEFDLAVEAGKNYVVVANGISGMNLGKYENPDPANRLVKFTVFAVADAKMAASDPAKFEFCALHGSTDTPKIDVLMGPLKILDDWDYSVVTPYVMIDPIKLQLDVTPADDNTNILISFALDLTTYAGKSAFVFASGFMTPKNDEGGKALGLFAALANGDVVEFPGIIKLPPGPWKDKGVSTDWIYNGVFDSTALSTHGVTVAKDNRIWIGSYGKLGILVYNPDGTQAPFSPINSVTIGGVAIDLTAGNCRGMTADHEGNILYAKGADLLKINSVTGEGMAKWTHSGSLVKPGVDNEGFIYAGKVAGLNPVAVIDPASFTLTQEITLPGAPSYARGMVVTPDGKGIYTGDLVSSGGPLYKWTSEDLVTYTKTDSIFANTDGKMIFSTQRTTMDWGRDGSLWVSHDNAYAAGDNSPNGLFVFDFKKMEYSFVPSPVVAAGKGNGPRGVAFSVTGDTAYSCSFNSNKVWRYIRKAGPARLQVVHNAADLDIATVDVYVDGALLLDNFGFRKATPFTEVPSGDHKVTIVPSTKTPADSVIAEFDVTLAAGKSYAVVVNGISARNINAKKYENPEPGVRDIALKLYPLPDVREKAMDPTKVEFCVFHGSTDAPAVDIMTGGAVLIDNLDYGKSTPYLAVPPGSYELDVAPAVDNALVVATFTVDVTALAGQSALVFASGFLTPKNDEGGKSLGLFAALPTGDVVEFKQVIRLPKGPWKNLGVSTDWVFKSVFDSLSISTHGVAVAKDNRIWVGSYGKLGILVYNPDGTQAPFSPLNSVTIGGVAIDLTAGNCRGMTADHEGNILYAKGADLLKINSATGEGMAKWSHSGSLVKPGVDNEGFIYAGRVAGINPVAVIDPVSFALTQEITLPGAPSYARGMVVTPDGKGIWTGDLGSSGGQLYNWTSEDLVTYTKTDSIYTNTDAQTIFSTQRTTMDWDRKGRLWVSHDNAYAAGDNSPNGLYAFDFKTMEYFFVPSPIVKAGAGNGPRGVAFSVTGDTAYVCSFNSNKVWRFVRRTDAIEGEQLVSLPSNYELEQNYPNPFNPTTTITFAIPEKGKVELKVFDNLGREVLTVLNRDLSAGKHSVMLDASKLATGVYHYRLKVNDMVITRRMTLVK